MIIDAHGHNIRRSYMSYSWWQGYAYTLICQPQIARGQPVTPLDEATDSMLDWMESLSDDGLVKEMDRAGVDQMVLLVIDFGLLLGDGKRSIEEQNYEVCMLARKYPKRLVPFAGVDPRRGKSGLDLFERSVKEWGARGLKIHPSAGFYLSDPACYLFYRKAVELNVPVLVHTGYEAPPARSRFGDPLHLDDVCCDFPGLRIVAAHMAVNPFWRPQLVQLARYHTNLRIDISALQPIYKRDPINFYKLLRADLDVLGPGKILFGSDHPYFAGRSLDLRRWVEVFRSPPPELAEHGIEFSRAEIDAIMGGNAHDWLTGEEQVAYRLELS